MTANLKISVVTPNFNGAALLARTVDSVLAQDYSNLEYIVVDGGSTDKSPEILNGYRHRLSKLIIERDRGQYDAINKGFACATGDVFCWLNSDDVYFPWTLRVVNRIFRDFPQIEWITGIRSELRDGAVQGMSNLTSFPRELLAGGAFYPGGLGCVMQECCFWRRSLFEKAGAWTCGGPLREILNCGHALPGTQIWWQRPRCWGASTIRTQIAPFEARISIVKKCDR